MIQYNCKYTVYGPQGLPIRDGTVAVLANDHWEANEAASAAISSSLQNEQHVSFHIDSINEA